MSDVTVKQFADVVGIPVDRLIAQLGDAGLSMSKAEETISDDEKNQLLDHLRKSHGKAEPTEPGAPRKITLRRKTQSELRVSGTRGQGKTVSVEVRKKRTYVKRSDILDEENRRLEKEAQEKAQEEAKLKAKEDEAQKKIDDEKAEEDKQRLAVEEEAKKQVEEEEKRKAELDAAKQAAIAKPEGETEKKKRKEQKPEGRGDKHTRYGRKELHVSGDKTGRRSKKKKKSRRVSVQGTTEHGFERPTAPVMREVAIPESISVADLAQKMSVKAAEVIKVMMGMGSMVTINQVLDQETSVIVVEEFGHKYTLVKDDAIEDVLIQEDEDVDVEEIARAPVVTIMGHVDHGKTSLLDYIRKSKVADAEAGGITQHIGAYHVDTDKGMISFLDTPGHAAFTAMRARGAKATDIIILVVAADDGVMPQTQEAIKHARAAEVPMIIAVNKMDKPEAQPDKVKQELVAEEVVPEDWGGDTMFVHVSAHTGEGVDELLDAILLQAEVLELKAPVDCPARGVVVESRLDKGRGPVATILVQRGTLKKGDMLIAGKVYGRIRAMLDENGKPIESAGPSIPVEILGLSSTPEAGDEASVVSDERKAREVAQFREDKQRDVRFARQQASKLENMFSMMENGEVNTLNLVIKADVQGSAEALNQSLNNLSTDEVKVNIVSSGVGGINESDVNLAAASNAVIFGFNVRADVTAKRLIEEENLDLHYYSVIYDVIDEVRKSLVGMLAPAFKEEITGLAEVRDVFRSAKLGAVAGCLVTEGAIKRNNPIRVLRDSVVIYEGELESLRRFKDDVNEVRSGTECGIGVLNYNDVKSGDQIEVFEKVQVTRTL